MIRTPDNTMFIAFLMSFDFIDESFPKYCQPPIIGSYQPALLRDNFVFPQYESSLTWQTGL